MRLIKTARTWLADPGRLASLFLWLMLITAAVSFTATLLEPATGPILMRKSRQVLPVTLPVYEMAERGEFRDYRVKVEAQPWSFGWIALTVDDCLQNFSVNGRPLQLPDLNQCHYLTPTRIYLSPYLMPGTNTLDFSARNIIGPMGFTLFFEAIPWHLEPLIKALAAVSFFAFALLKAGRMQRWGPVAFWLTNTGMFISCLMYFTTPYNTHVNDIVGHTDYIRYIAEQWKLPLPVGWQSQQPPLYYVVAALFYKAGELLGIDQPIYAARLVSLPLYMAFVFINIELIRCYLAGRYALMAVALLVFWPDGFTYSGRINNDSAMQVMMSLTLYLGSRWYFSKDIKWLRWAWYSALLGMTIKANALVSIAFMLAMTALAIGHKESSPRFFLNWRLWLIAALGGAVSFGRTFYYRVFEHMDISWLMNVDLKHSPVTIVANFPYNYLYFDVARFIALPHAFSWPNDDLFWNVFLKTLLLGEWFWQSPVACMVLSALFLLMFGLVVVYLMRWSLFYHGNDYRPLCTPLAVMMLLMIAGMVFKRFSVPWTTSANARHVCGLLTILAIYFARSAEWHRREHRLLLARAHEGMVIAFCASATMLAVFEFGY